MKKIIVISLLLAALISVPIFRFYSRDGLVVVQSCESGGHKWSVTTLYKGDRVRKDIEGGTSMIFDLVSGDTITLDHAQKTFTRHSLAQMIEVTRRLLGQTASSPGAPPELTDTGKKETVNGHAAEIYTSETPYAQFICWMDNDYPAYSAMNDRMKKYRLLEKIGGLYPDVSKLDGMMVKSQIVYGTGSASTFTLVSTKIEPVDDSVFQLPAGYKETAQQPAEPPAPKP